MLGREPKREPQKAENTIAKARNSQELFAAIIDIGDIVDSGKTYKSFEVIRIIQEVLKGQKKIEDVTKEHGIREKVEDIQDPSKKEKREHELLVSKNLDYLNKELGQVVAKLFQNNTSTSRTSVLINTETGEVLKIADFIRSNEDDENSREDVIMFEIITSAHRKHFINYVSLHKILFFEGDTAPEGEAPEIKLSDKAKDVLFDTVERWNTMSQVT